jgi:hypothetical protein
LKAGEWFRRGRLLMVSPVHGDYRRCQAEIPLIVLFRFPGPALSDEPTGERGSSCEILRSIPLVFFPINPGIAGQNDATPILQQKIVAKFSEQIGKLVERAIGPGGHVDAAPREVRVAPKH